MEEELKARHEEELRQLGHSDEHSLEAGSALRNSLTCRASSLETHILSRLALPFAMQAAAIQTAQIATLRPQTAKP